MNSKHIVIKYVWKRIVTNIKINRVLVVVATGSSSEVQSKSFPRESDRDELQTKWSEYWKKKEEERITNKYGKFWTHCFSVENFN